jgi:hypothetical protein
MRAAKTLSRWVVVLLWFLITGKGEGRDASGIPQETMQQVMAAMESILDGVSLVKPRELQSTSTTATYWVNYTAQFQVTQDTSCTAPSPVIRVLCAGTDIQVHATSDPSIVCSTTRRVSKSGFSYLECTNTCANDTCSEIYLNVDQDVADGPFATIDFSCAGSTLVDVDGAMEIVEPTDQPSCAASASQNVTRVFNVARLGVSCPPLNDEGNIAQGNSAASTTRTIVYDDYYFECSPSRASYPLSDTDNSYTCLDGKNCKGAACNVNLTSLYVDADVPAFQDTCVQTATPSIPIPEYTAPNVSAAELAAGTTYTARFEAAWSVQFTPRTEFCPGVIPLVVIACWNSEIRFISSIHDSMNCSLLAGTAFATNSLGCSADGPGVGINEFVSVVYVSPLLEGSGIARHRRTNMFGSMAPPSITCTQFALENVLMRRSALDRSFPKRVY